MTASWFGDANVILYSIALGILSGLLVLELAALLLGGSLFGADSSDTDVDFDVELGADGGPEFDLDADLDADLGVEGASSAGAAEAASSSSGVAGALAWLGVGRAPLMVWIATFLAAFGASGLVLQALIDGILSTPAPWPLTLAATAPIGLIAAKALATTVGRLLPKVQTTAVAKNALGGRLGVVTGAEGRRGRPTEVRVKDQHGATHYVHAEPLDDAAVLAAGAEVVVFRKPVNGVFRAMAYEDAVRSPAR